jgi:peptidoglycan/LPS O-acetylase OafA/YrhL
MVLYMVLRHFGLHAVPYHQEVLLGWGLGLPLLHVLSRRRFGRLDALAGDLSYGVFLNHFLLIWWFGLDRAPPGAAQLAVLAGASLLLSYGTQRLVEQPVLRWRQRLRLS